MSFIKDLVEEQETTTGIVSDGAVNGDVDSFVDTGSYVFNVIEWSH